MKKVALYMGILGALASIGTLVLPKKAVSHSSSGNNSPVITGDGNNVNYQGGFPDLETTVKLRHGSDRTPMLLLSSKPVYRGE